MRREGQGTNEESGNCAYSCMLAGVCVPRHSWLYSILQVSIQARTQFVACGWRLLWVSCNLHARDYAPLVHDWPKQHLKCLVEKAGDSCRQNENVNHVGTITISRTLVEYIVVLFG